MKLSLVYAQLQNGVIGYAGPEPMAWHIPEDLKHFKAVTMGKAMLMGSNTFDSLPRLLPGRFHYVLTKRKGLHRLGRLTDVQFVGSIDEAIQSAKELGFDEIIGIGGGDVIKQMVKIADEIHLTVINGVEIDADKPKVVAPDVEAYGFGRVSQVSGEHPGVQFEKWIRE